MDTPRHGQDALGLPQGEPVADSIEKLLQRLLRVAGFRKVVVVMQDNRTGHPDECTAFVAGYTKRGAAWPVADVAKLLRATADEFDPPAPTSTSP